MKEPTDKILGGPSTLLSKTICSQCGLEGRNAMYMNFILFNDNSWLCANCYNGELEKKIIDLHTRLEEGANRLSTTIKASAESDMKLLERIQVLEKALEVKND